MTGAPAGVGSINPRYKPPHAPRVIGVVGELLPEPALLTTRLGVKERTQRQRGAQSGLTPPYECPSHRPAEDSRVERVSYESIDAALHQRAAGRGPGKRREVPSQRNGAAYAAAARDQQQARSTEGQAGAVPLPIPTNGPAQDDAQQGTLSHHPEPAAVKKVGIHLSHPEQPQRPQAPFRNTRNT
jgi:hypothetical protein